MFERTTKVKFAGDGWLHWLRGSQLAASQHKIGDFRLPRRSWRRLQWPRDNSYTASYPTQPSPYADKTGRQHGTRHTFFQNFGILETFMAWSGTAATDDTLILTLHTTTTTATVPPANTPPLTTPFHKHAGRHPGMYLHHHHNRTQTRNYTLRDFSQLWPRYARTYALLTGHKHAHHEALHMHDSPPPALTMSPPYHPHLTGRKSAHAQTGTFTYNPRKETERRRRWKRGGALRNERAIFCSRSVARCKRSARTLRAVESTDSNGPVSLQQRTAC